MCARAPAVSLHCKGGPLWRALQLLLPALAVAVFSVWLWGQWRPGADRSAPVLVAVMLLPGLAAAAVAYRYTPRQHVALLWDGQCWLAGDTPGTPQVMIDLGAWLLLRFCPVSPVPTGKTGAPRRQPPTWLAVARADAGNPATWQALRVALYARPPGPSVDTPSAR